MILQNISAGQNITLISPRKMGKTGLIHHVFYNVKTRNLPFETLYADIYATSNLEEFIQTISEVILQKFPEKNSIGDRFIALIKALRPVISYDAISGAPQVSFNLVTVEEKQHTLKTLFEFLNNQNCQIIFAIDEFQQISEYPEKNIEALLRGLTQNLHNLHFIYCGSNRQMMAEMFQTAGRPFFSSTRTLFVEEIATDKYSVFIREKFGSTPVDDDALALILDWTRRHTFYTQSLCNTIFEYQPQRVTVADVKHAIVEILQTEASSFLQLRNLLPAQQWLLLIAIAKEGFVESVGSQKFITSHKLGSATNARRALEALVEKEMVLAVSTPDKTLYRVYNVFFERWLETI